MPERLLTYGTLVFALVCVLLTPSIVEAQQIEPPHQTEPAVREELSTSPTGSIDILYTGKLMGHFRVPDVQGPAADGSGCGQSSPSIAANDFDEIVKTQLHSASVKKPILVGTGDNFAPELEAREFCKPPTDPPGVEQKVQRRTKEQFSWDTKLSQPQWVTNEYVLAEWKKEQPQVRTRCEPNTNSIVQQLQCGDGIIPFDNVANFFLREGYAALVPGKHDFYFGAERLRELARFLASTPIDNGSTLHEENVQMLGANLVIETSWKTDHKPLPDNETYQWFVPRFPQVQDLLGVDQSSLKKNALLETQLKLTGLSDGGSVYPWFQGAGVQIVGPDPNGVVAAEFARTKVFLCSSDTEGDPNALKYPRDNNNCGPELDVVRDEGGDGTKFTIGMRDLLPGQNYGLCLDVARSHFQDKKGSRFYCVRFSIYTPFFQYPWNKTAQSCPDPPKSGCYRNPEPYVLLHKKDEAGIMNDIAIFGVVDPHLTDYVGLLNLAWSNTKEKKFKTITAAKDPAEALKELLDYFDHRYKAEFGRADSEPRRLIKILLAQMSPQAAQVLATRLGTFQVVVSAADPDLASVEDPTTTEWNAPRTSDRRYPIFLAIPEPYYVASRRGKVQSHWIADIGRLSMKLGPDLNGRWTLFSEHLEPEIVDYSSREIAAPPDRFWPAVSNYLNKSCLAHVPRGYLEQDFSLPAATLNSQLRIQWLTACVMQEKLKADVVLLQKRDLFVDLPYVTQTKHDSLQAFLDRLIWKGDLLTFMYVPGSTLQNVLKQSKVYDDDDASQISLSDEKLRGLVPLGVKHVAESDEYFINEIPLDTTRLYAVATTDFISAGDTGYPDLAANAIRPLTGPTDFDPRLITISSLVCRKLKMALQDWINARDSESATDCLDPLSRDAYLDDIVAAPTNTRQVDSTKHEFWKWTIFERRRDPSGTPSKASVPQPADRLEQSVEQRGLASRRVNPPDGTLFALNNAALSFNLLNHKFSDAAVGQTFPGNPVPQLLAKRSHAIGYDITPQLGYSWHRFKLFENTEERYNIQYTGNANAARTINQKDNLLSSDTGLAFDFRDRALPHFEAVASFHYETQIQHPTAATLAPLPKGDSLVPPVDTGRTHYLLPRIGARFVNRTSWIEIGLEDGGQLQAVRLIPVTPPPTSGPSFHLLRDNIPVSGTYWKWHLVVPFSNKVSWTVDEDGDLFFNQHDDSQTDTRFRSDTKTGVNFKVFPSLSFAPTYEFFYYSNKVRGDWYWQGQASIQMKFQFDFWNGHHWSDELKYKIPAPSPN
jgi:hypothetical protein